jgi:hypothetical protein
MLPLSHPRSRRNATQSRRLELPPARRKAKPSGEAESKLRRGGQHCPLCLDTLPRISGKGQIANKCMSCGAQPQPGKRCSKCKEEAIWESKAEAACQSCGRRGSRLLVIAGAHEDR